MKGLAWFIVRDFGGENAWTSEDRVARWLI
jgi:hypothetical protein